MRSAPSPSSSARSRRDERRLHDRLVHDGARILGRVALRVLVHQARQQLLIERAPVDADAHRLFVPQRDVDDGAELAVLLLLEADVAGIDAVLVERFRRGRVLAQQLVSDVVEIADERHAHAAAREPVANMRHGLRRLVAIDRDAHELGARARQRRHLIDGCRRCRPCRCWSSTVRRPDCRRRRSHRRRKQRRVSRLGATRSVSEPCMVYAFAD